MATTPFYRLPEHRLVHPGSAEERDLCLVLGRRDLPERPLYRERRSKITYLASVTFGETG